MDDTQAPGINNVSHLTLKSYVAPNQYSLGVACAGALVHGIHYKEIKVGAGNSRPYLQA